MLLMAAAFRQFFSCNARNVIAAARPVKPLVKFFLLYLP